MEFNLDAAEERLTEVAAAMKLHMSQGEGHVGEAVLRKIREWTTALEIPQNLSLFGVREEHLTDLSVAASKVTRLMDNNPKPMSVQEIERIYRKLLS
jgi:alcohol dehydrogenase class IV